MPKLFQTMPLAALALALASPGHAQGQSSDPYAAMVDVFASDQMRDRAFEAIMQSAFGSLVEVDPNVASLELQCPGFVDGLAGSMRPLMKESHNQDHLVYREDLRALLTSEMTAAEAQGAADFFGSPLGQRFFDQVFANQNLDSMMREAVASEGEKDISVDSIQSDTNRTAIRAMMSLEPVDREEILRVFSTEEWGKAFAELRPKMDALLADPKFQQTTPEEDAAIESASVAFAERHFEQCFSGAAE